MYTVSLFTSAGACHATSIEQIYLDGYMSQAYALIKQGLYERITVQYRNK